MRGATLSLLTVAVAIAATTLAVTAGQGSAAPSFDSPLTALRTSHFTYFAYTDPRWWGRDVHVGIVRLRISRRNADFAGAILTVHDTAGKELGRPQLVLLRRSRGWRAVRAQDNYSPFECVLAPRGVLQELFGQCDSSPYVVWPTTLISGPLDERAPTAAELAGVIAANRKTVYPHGDGCVRYRVSVSVLDSTYALTEYRPSGKHVPGCYVGNGVSLFRRLPSGWTLKAGASDPFPCTDAPPGVIRSLTYACWVIGGPH